MYACTNPDILRVIWFFKMIVNIIKIIIPIGLIILGIVDFSKAMITSDENAQKKSGKLFAKRILYAILVFTVPWLIEVLMVTLGNLIGEEGKVNFTDCIENADGERIEYLESNSCTNGNVMYNINFYYEENLNSKIDSVLACTFDELPMDRVVEKDGCKNKGWRLSGREFWDQEGNLYFDTGEEWLELVKKYSLLGGVDLIAVWQGTPFTIKYYDETGTMLEKEAQSCTETPIYFSAKFKDGYKFKGWKIRGLANRDAEKSGAIFTDERIINESSDIWKMYIANNKVLNLVPVYEKING